MDREYISVTFLNMITLYCLHVWRQYTYITPDAREQQKGKPSFCILLLCFKKHQAGLSQKQDTGLHRAFLYSIKAILFLTLFTLQLAVWNELRFPRTISHPAVVVQEYINQKDGARGRFLSIRSFSFLAVQDATRDRAFIVLALCHWNTFSKQISLSFIYQTKTFLVYHGLCYKATASHLYAVLKIGRAHV